MKKGFTLIELMIVIAIIAIIAAIAIPGLLAAQRASNERNASASLKTITTAQADFRSNDRDGNLINDFWTADVYALYALVPMTGGAVTVLPGTTTSAANIIKLIEPSVAGADGQTALAGYGYLVPASAVVTGSPKAGYLYRMFGSEEVGTVVSTLLVDTDGAVVAYGAVHHRTNFAASAFPESLSAGKLMFVVNADNTIYKYNLPATYAFAAYTPMSGTTTNSTCTVAGTGAAAPAVFNFTAVTGGAAVFPQSPQGSGCSKLD